MNGALGWLGQLVVMVLSLLATFSIIGSIAAIPSGSIEGRLGLERPRYEAVASATDEQAERPSAPQPAEEPAIPQAAGDPGRMVPTIAASPERENLLRWLEPLTYGVIALAGLMAIAVLFLWRIAAALDARR